MQKSEIKLNHAYRDNKDQVRLVIGEYDRENVRYKVMVKSSNKGNSYPVGYEENMTRQSFAKWAQREVDNVSTETAVS